MMDELTGKRIFIAGHNGMLGAALCRNLRGRGIAPLTVPRRDVDLTRQSQVRDWIMSHRPDTIIIAAAKVGGIMANRNQPVEFLYENMMIAANIMHVAHAADVQNLLFVASSAAYPADAQQPLTEAALFDGLPDPSHNSYAMAKRAAITLAGAYRAQYGRNYFSVLPTNLYGPGDNFDPDTSHVVPALIRKAVTAAQTGTPFTIWGSGQPKRELLHVDDCAEACLFLTGRTATHDVFNVGSGMELSIRELAGMIARHCGYRGEIDCDTSKPDGAMRRALDSRRLNLLGWQPLISLDSGLAATCQNFLAQQQMV